jgi:hypothetical protein
MMTREYDRNECWVCSMRRKRLEGAQEPERIAVPPGELNVKSDASAKPVGAGRVIWDPVNARFSDTKPAPSEPIRPKPETITPKEETSMADDKAKERVLSRILREKACSRGRLMNYCGVSKDELEEVTAALAGEGKIKAWPKGRACIYTPPDAADPHTAGTGNNQQKPAATVKMPPPATPRVARATAPVAKPAPSNGSGSIAAVIADLEKRRTDALDTVERADAAIKALRALA